MKKLSFAISLALLCTAGYAQDTLKVPSEYSTIQAAIDAANDGDLVLAADGTYYENIRFKGKAIIVGSGFVTDGDTSHISRTIIDGSHSTDPDSGSVVYFVSGEDTNSVLCGFTITGGTGTTVYGAYYHTYDRIGGGILAMAGARISHNTIAHNAAVSAKKAVGMGGGIYSLGNVIVEYNNINNNTALSEGHQGLCGGVSLIGANCRLVGNSITDNTARSNAVDWNANGGGVGLIAADKVIIRDNLIARNKVLSPNCVTHACNGGGLHSYMPAGLALFCHNVFVENIAQGKAGSCGGAISLWNGDNIVIRNNLIARNSASIGGGVAFGLDAPANGAPKFINNTAVSNVATSGQGGAIYSQAGWTPHVVNSILWRNAVSSGSGISGSVSVRYSDVQGGYSGTGNIDIDPLFADSVSYYLAANSPCIDAGNPDVTYNDIENPSNPDHPLPPGLGTLRGDMGLTGGNPFVDLNNSSSGEKQLIGPNFRAFVERVNRLDSAYRQSIVDAFMDTVASFPVIEQDTVVYYLYQGAANHVTVPGDANAWNTVGSTMTSLEGTDLWYCEAVYETDARLDYQFLINDSIWTTDPRNPNRIWSAYGPNSELAMPAYIQPDEIEYYADIPHGAIDSISFTSASLANTRTVKVYTPPGYKSESSKYYPVVLFHDGIDYLIFGSANNILDYLIKEENIVPVICVFVPPASGAEREAEYASTRVDGFETFIVEELMPHIDSAYRTVTDPSKRGMVGMSYGGLITAQICYNHPETFGLAALFSPAFAPRNKQVHDSVVNAARKNIKWYVDWGTYEPAISGDALSFREGLKSKGYEPDMDYVSKQWHEAHSWGNWRAHLDIALDYFFPGANPVLVGVHQKADVPVSFALMQNYPNPFNPVTAISYQLSAVSHVSLKVYDILGREVATLVNEKKGPGTQVVKFDASGLSSGVYLYRLQAGASTSVKKMMLLK